MRHFETEAETVLEYIRGYRRRGGSSVLLALDGRCAAGKTTLAAALKEKTGCNVIHMDDFFLRPNQRTERRLQEPGGNVDYERVREEVLLPLTQGRAFSYRVYDCGKGDFSGEIEVQPAEITVVEGSYSCHPVLWEFYDMRIFLQIDGEEQARRIRRRNGEEKAVLFRDRWIPLEERYFAAFRIEERCDFILSAGKKGLPHR